MSDESDIGVAGVTGLTDEFTRLIDVSDAVGMSGIPAFAAVSGTDTAGTPDLRFVRTVVVIKHHYYYAHGLAGA